MRSLEITKLLLKAPEGKQITDLKSSPVVMVSFWCSGGTKISSQYVRTTPMFFRVNANVRIAQTNMNNVRRQLTIDELCGGAMKLGLAPNTSKSLIAFEIYFPIFDNFSYLDLD